MDRRRAIPAAWSILALSASLFGLHPMPGRAAPRAEPAALNTLESLDRAIHDLAADVGARYPKGEEYLRRLEALRQAGATSDDPRVEQLRREALLANPLLDGLRLIFVKRHNFSYSGEGAFVGYTSYACNPPAELCVLESVRDEKPPRALLRTETGCIRDPDVSFDGRRILFAYSERKRSYSLYEINADGGGMRQLTKLPPYEGPEPKYKARGRWDDVEPCYLPNGDIVFGSGRYVRFVDCVDPEPVTTLFLMDGEGNHLRGISANHVHDWHPAVLGDGRIVYTRWEYTDRSQMWPHKLFVKNPDGSGTFAYYGSNSWWPVSMFHARAVPGSSRVLCTLAGHHSGADQTGEIGLLAPSRGTEETEGLVALFPPRRIEAIYQDDPRPAQDIRYTEPYPLSDRYFIVSFALPERRDKQGKRIRQTFGLYLADFFGNRLLLYRDEQLDSLSAMPLAPRPLPPMIAPRTDYRRKDATMVLADVYHGAGMAGVARGTVKALRIIDFDVRDTPSTGGLRQDEGRWGGHSNPLTALGGSWHVKRILGTVPVHPDGSAAFRIPAERRIFFQVLDERGRAIQTMRTWVEAMPGERMSCIGCHEATRESSPVRSTLLALAKEPVEPTPWYGPPRAFSFVREVQPVLDRHCVRCHDAKHKKGIDLRGDATNWFCMSYENLRPFVHPIGPSGMPAMLKPRERGAAASRLVEMLLAGHQDLRLDAESLDRIITWIDLNVPYYDNTAVTRPGSMYGREERSGRAVVHNGKPLWDALPGRCWDCHPVPGAPRSRGAAAPASGTSSFFSFSMAPVQGDLQFNDLPKTMTRPCVNLTHPDESRVLTAPLAKAAGGLQLCGEAIFADRNAPRYQAALKVIRSWHEDLVARPREDMPGFEACDGYKHTQAKREAWLKIEAETRRALSGETPQPVQ